MTSAPRHNGDGGLQIPDLFAAACLFLASPMAAFITGVTLPVDGGQALWGDNWAIAKPTEHQI